MDFDILYGINTINSLLAFNSGSRKIYEIIISQGRKNSSRIIEIARMANKKNIAVKELDHIQFFNFVKDKFNDEEIAGTQGILARVSNYNFRNLDELLESPGCPAPINNYLLVILDEVTDVGNFGSILRNCGAFGVDGVVISKNRSADVNRRVSKISSGALEELKIFRVGNLVNAIESLKEKKFWIYGTTLEKKSDVVPADRLEYYFPMAIIFGSEDKGMGRLVMQHCDFMTSINMPGSMQSLNVSTASGIMLYIIKNFQNKKSENQN
jgi:23S rRNA (guanosine2251-2'-O)-methyltransferase